MQDRFKFRVWEKDQKIMKECTQITLDKDQKGSICDVKDKVTAHLIYQPHYILMQCTGLKDKNGKLIYENDIVEITKEFWNKEQYTRYYLVCWDRTQWQLGLFKWQRPKAQNNRRCDRKIPFKNIVSFDDYTPNKYFAQCEVVGNYYENEDLLESESE